MPGQKPLPATSLAVRLASRGPSSQHPPWLCGCSAPLRSGDQGSVPPPVPSPRAGAPSFPSQLANAISNSTCFDLYGFGVFFPPFRKERSLHPVPSGSCRIRPEASTHLWDPAQGLLPAVLATTTFARLKNSNPKSLFNVTVAPGVIRVSIFLISALTARLSCALGLWQG